MWCPAELVFKNYEVKKLEKGMLFLNIIKPNTHKITYEVFSLDKVPRDEEAFLSLNGFPIELSILIEGKQVCNHNEIGWFDLGESFDTLTQISLKEINIIFNEYDSWLDVTIDEDVYDLKEKIVPVFIEDKVLLRFYVEEENDDEDYSDDEYLLIKSGEGRDFYEEEDEEE